MHPDNDLYGHRTALNRYLGRDDAERMLVHLQHGWSWTSPVLDVRRVVSHRPVLAWSPQHAADLAAAGVKRVVPIGAPFLYLEDDGTEPEQERRTVALPSHSWRRGSPEDDSTAVRFADELAERFGDAVTVCVHDSDLRRAPVIDRYRQHGFRIEPGDGTEGFEFLMRRRRLLQSARRVVSNVVSTGVLYGGILGRDIEVFGSVVSIYGPDYSRRFAQYQRCRWPELTGGGLEGSDAVELASLELGAESVRSPAELAQLAPPASTRVSSARFTTEYHARRMMVVVSRRRRGQDPNRVFAERALDAELRRLDGPGG